jgi:Kef-type K+ transport system membrane component KefB
MLLIAAIMIGAGLYLIQRGRFFFPVLIQRSPYLRTHPKVARFFFFIMLTLAILMAGMGCRILLTAIRQSL